MPFRIYVILVLTFAIPWLLGVRRAQSATIFVNASLSTGANSGMNWPDAYQGPLGLQSALATAQPGDELWLAQGTYVPTDDGDRQVSFVLGADITLLGGFAGNESAPDQRSPDTNVTVLSGDLVGNDGPNFSNRSDNSFHVIFLVGTNDTIDGFTIRGGNASGLGGGGLLYEGPGDVTLTIRRCIFTENEAVSGGGMAVVKLSGE